MLPNDIPLNGASPMKPNQRYKSLPHKKTTGFYTDGSIYVRAYSNKINCSPCCYRNSNTCSRCRCVL
jgi:hypothetical protein